MWAMRGRGIDRWSTFLLGMFPIAVLGGMALLVALVVLLIRLARGTP